MIEDCTTCGYEQGAKTKGATCGPCFDGEKYVNWKPKQNDKKEYVCYDCVHFDIKQPKDKTQRCAKDHIVYGTDEINTFCKKEFIPREGGMIMDEIRKKCDTHMVFKIENLKEALKEEELQLLDMIHEKIWNWRKKKGKTVEGYIVINRDEPYANLLQEWILWFEKMKLLWEKANRPLQIMTLPSDISEEDMKLIREQFKIVVENDKSFIAKQTRTYQCSKCGQLMSLCNCDEPSFIGQLEGGSDAKEQLKFPDWKRGCELLQHDPTGELEICNHPENRDQCEGNCYEDNCPTFHKGEKERADPPVNHARCPKCSHDYDIRVYAMCPKCCDEKEKEYCKMKDKEAEDRLERQERMIGELEDVKQESDTDEHPSEN